MADDKKIIFSMVGVSKAFQANKQVLKDIYLSFFYGAKIGIIGLNGSGKSTLMKIIAGLEKSYQGEVVFSPGYSVGYLAQEPHLDDEKTVKEVVMEGVQSIVDTLAEYEEINNKFGLPEYYEDSEKMDALFARQAELQDIIDATDAWNLDSKLERAMDALRCPPEDQPVKNLSGGERRRVALCRLLLQKPDILLLDEPTNHLDAESIDWLEQHLQQYEGTVIAVTHDRYFLDHVAGWILELDRGEGIPWKGNYSSWLEQKTKRMEMEEKVASKRRKTLERELDWVRMAPKARQAKGKARLNSYDKLLNEDVKEKEEKLEIFIPNGPRLGNKVIEAKGVAKAYGDKLLFDNLNFMLPPNGIVGVIGPNGAGKTTLFRLIMGLETVDKGTFEVGETVKLAYVDQQHKDIDPAKSVYQVISGGNELIRLGNRDINARAYLSRFNFSGADQEKLCGMLSGGERNRLHLAMALKEEGNVLLLDEPLAALDLKLRKDMQIELKRIQQQVGITFIYVTHDQSEAMALSDSIIIMNKGVVAQIGSPQEIYYHPNSEFVADFIGEANFLRGKCVALEGGSGVLQLADTQVRVAATENMAVGEDYTIVLRPESAGLVPEGNLKCRVVLSCFMGAYQNYHVMVGDTLVKLTDYNPKNHRIYQVGETCALTFEPDGVHVL